MKKLKNESMEKKFNTGETPMDLKKEYNPEGSLLRQVQLRLLDMMIYLDDVCKEIGVSYRIDSGNVLGAIRHGGFIPWDDDVDVVVENRHDYNRLIKYLETHPHPNYVIQNEFTDKGHNKFWSVLRDKNSEYIHKNREEDIIDRVQQYRGLQVDIFLYECTIPFLKRVSAFIHKKYSNMFLVNHISIYRFCFSVQKNIIHPIFRLFSYILGNKKMLSHSYGTVWLRYTDVRVLMPHKPILFEGHFFPGPADPIAYLESAYGDWRDLPEKKDRAKHNVKYILK